MKRLFAWSTWSIGTKILVPFLLLVVIAMSVLTYIAFSDINTLGDYALDTSTDLGTSAIEDSTQYLVRLGERIVTQKASDIGRQVEMYLASHPHMTIEEMRQDQALRDIVVQPVGETGYTTLIDPVHAVIVIHRFPAQEKDITPLRELLPSFWALIEASARDVPVSGYYNWLEVDGRITEKYAGIVPINAPGYETLTLWATTYIEEFSDPVNATRREIIASIDESAATINRWVASTQRAFFISFGGLVVVVTLVVLLLSRALTRPIVSLREGAAEIGRGNLDLQLDVKNHDELGDLAAAFNVMATDLKSYIGKLEKTAEDNLAKERTIQENLRNFARNISRAQEDERKRIARDLHDDTLQSLVVIARELEELSNGGPEKDIADIREEVRELARRVRRFSQELRPSILDDLGLIPALQWLAGELTNNYDVDVTVEVTGTQHEPEAEIELSLFRIVQEALTNVRKHAEASRAVVTVAFTDTGITVSVTDNGRGFVVPERDTTTNGEGKLGLIGMRERIEILGGTFEIRSAPGRGTTVTVSVAG